ncbi:MAG: AAA family ATPase [Gammaproteobacteria bacterium]|nr:AAA family ATPase [Gammaproteobacteria bacterium]
MKIVNLVVENFRAINRVELTDLKDMIVVAGPNGCGKSCVLDAIRLFKSVYGGYQPNEWHQWMTEFQINMRNLHRMALLLRNRSQPAVIEADIELADEERQFIQENISSMLLELAWKTVVPNSQAWGRSANSLATELRAYQPQVVEKFKQLLSEIQERLNHRLLRGKLEISPDGQAATANNVLLELVFSSFHPKRIGVIDYHGAHRNYAREELGGINLNLDQEEERLRTTSLYNAQNKYSNIKSEMAAEFVKQSLKEKHFSRDASAETTQPLTETLRELFKTFFPGKTFLGPVPTSDGNLGFPVQTGDGPTHDINDLSSGEKEILFGYLRLRNSAPRYSVILLDEPELHLNPALVRGLPQFYYKHIGKELENQICLVTHSDAFLREAIGHEDLQVFHMQHATDSEETGNQMHELHPGEEVESIILELVGNLATYSPGAKVVFLEGQDSEFDLHMVSRLFPSIENKINLVSGGNRFRVERLHRTLERSVEAGSIPVKIYSVVDKDSGPQIVPTSEFRRHFSWDEYHIENYLLEPKFIDEALGHLGCSHADLSSLGKIDQCLREIAENQIGRLVGHRIRSKVNSELVGDLKLGANPMSDDIGADLFNSIERSVNRINDRLKTKLNIGDIRELVETERRSLSEALTTEDWRKHFRGRDILREFAGKYVRGMAYEYFRELIISQMLSSNYQPAGMKAVLDQILAD